MQFDEIGARRSGSAPPMPPGVSSTNFAPSRWATNVCAAPPTDSCQDTDGVWPENVMSGRVESLRTFESGWPSAPRIPNRNRDRLRSDFGLCLNDKVLSGGSDVTLQVGSNSRMRCQSFTDIPISELFGPAGSGPRTYASYLEKAGRVADFLEFAELMCLDALHREESCGGHFRVEHQTEDGEALRNDEDFAYVAAWEWTGVGEKPNLHKEPLAFEAVELAQRSYQ